MAIEERISAAKANRRFLRLLHAAREGHCYVVTAHGRPIARPSPIGEAASADDRRREATKRELLARVALQPVIDIGRWTWDELYDR
jgi:prevent-host-death family protein